MSRQEARDRMEVMQLLSFSAALEEEIQERLEIAHEGEDNAHIDRNEIVKEMMQDMDDKEMVAYSFRHELQDFGAAVGIFEGYTKERIDRMVTTGGRKYEFKRGPLFYVFKDWKALDEVQS